MSALNLKQTGQQRHFEFMNYHCILNVQHEISYVYTKHENESFSIWEAFKEFTFQKYYSK